MSVFIKIIVLAAFLHREPRVLRVVLINLFVVFTMFSRSPIFVCSTNCDRIL